jgi:mRNA-degrading endonuclease toxin of MazEF toxin-antitoxin module
MSVLGMEEMNKGSVVAHRRGVYQFKTKNGEFLNDRYALVVSREDRCRDKLVNILIVFLDSEERRDFSSYVNVQLENGMSGYVNCGLVTYCYRSQLGKEISYVTKSSMNRVNRSIREELGFGGMDGSVDDTVKHMQYQIDLYERLYNDLLKCVSR